MQRGFTLMELVIAMVIIGILTAIAIPTYTQYIQRSNRAEARNQLLEAATWTERFRTERGRYDLQAAPGTQALPLALRCAPRNATGVGCRDYNIAFTAVAPATFAISATPVAGGRMAADACGTFSIDQAGARLPTAPADCWTR